jgi:hypothetical protein
MEIAKMKRGGPRWEWTVGIFILLSLVALSRLGHRLPRFVQWAAFFFIFFLPLIFTAMSWAGFGRVRRDQNELRWRIWLCFCGCMALSLALLMPVLVIVLTLDYTRWSIWILGSSVVALLAGIFGTRSARSPLVFGGLIIGSLVLMIPVGIL